LAQEIGDSELLDTWASDGTIVEPSEAKKANGWDQGEQPPFEYANWTLNTLFQKINHILQHGIPFWNSSTEYLTGDICSYSGVIYRAKTDNTNSEPPNNNWVAIGPFNVKNSIETDNGSHQLVGDEDEPGANKMYATDGSGDKGWRPLPTQADGFTTGDIKWRYDTEPQEGWVRLNARTIGNAGSAATERENADTEALFKHLWAKGEEVSGGRGATAQADWDAQKRITLPDARACVPVALDGMGNANTDRVSNALTLGARGGSEEVTLAKEHIPPIPIDIPSRVGGGQAGGLAEVDNPTETFRINAGGGGQPHDNMPPYTVMGMVYIKL